MLAEVEFRYRFVPPGTSLDSQPCTVALDVGNRLAPGVIDQHQDGTLGESTTELLVARPELVLDHLRDCEAIDVVVHHRPDFDALSSVFLVQRMLAEGRVPAWASWLADYGARVDQGRAGGLGGGALADAPHLAMLALAYLVEDEVQLVRRGVELMELAVQRHEDGSADWTRGSEFADVVAHLEADRARWLADRDAASAGEVELPTVSGARRRVRSLVLNSPPGASLAKYWARAEGIELLVVPLGDASARGGAAVYPRVIVSVPGLARQPQPDAVTLAGLGATLERRETDARKELGLRRTGSPRWGDTAYTDNGDPWYDGRGHGLTIVDAPSGGTVLAYADVIELVQSF